MSSARQALQNEVRIRSRIVDITSRYLDGEVLVHEWFEGDKKFLKIMGFDGQLVEGDEKAPLSVDDGKAPDEEPEVS